MKRKNAKKKHEPVINTRTGRVFTDGGFVGYGILEEGTYNVHMTHDNRGKVLQERHVLTVKKMVDEN